MPTKTEIITVPLYGGSVVVEFLPNSHSCRLNGERLVSVTQATGVVDKSPQLLAWAERLTNEYVEEWLEAIPKEFPKSDSILGVDALRTLVKEAAAQHRIKKEEAATIGDLVHQFAHDYARAKIEGSNLPRVDDLPRQAINGINAFVDWVRKHKVEFKEVERLVYSKKHNYWGIFDALAVVDGDLTLLDYKTSKGVYNTFYAQASAYWYALCEESNKIKKVDILHFNKEDGSFHVYPVKELKETFQAFLRMLELKHWDKKTSKALKGEE